MGLKISKFGLWPKKANFGHGFVVLNINLMGHTKGTTRGMVTQARLSTYKVCWVGGCFSIDILEAISKEITNGVNMFSLWLGGGAWGLLELSCFLGTFRAMEKDVFVS